MGVLVPEEGADGKTERGTDRKREDARKEGKVAQSQEVVSVVTLGAAIIAFMLILPYMRHYLTGFMLNWSQLDVKGNWSIEFVQGLCKQGLLICALGVMPIGLAVLFSSTIASIAQTKPFFQTEALKPKFDALNPVNGAKQLFSMESIVKLFISILKVMVIALVVWGVVKDKVPELSFLHRLSIVEGLQWFMVLFSRIVWRVMALFITIAVIDWIKETRKFEKSIMMSKQEVKDELKNQESSQLVKQRMRGKMRELSAARMMAAVPDATVVVTNPTFIAIAIKYNAASPNAPIVVAKGKRLVAHKIREIARENGVSVIERKPLARAMYKKIEVGKPVPAEYFQAIAELLAYLYRMGDTRIREQLAQKK